MTAQSLGKIASLLGMVLAGQLLAASTATALSCPKCYHQPRLCNWATWGYYPTQWRPWPMPEAGPGPCVADHGPVAQPMSPPVIQYFVTPAKPNAQPTVPETLKPPEPVPPPVKPPQPVGIAPTGMSTPYSNNPFISGRHAFPQR